MSQFFIEPILGRIAISAPPKVACCSLRLWLYEIAYGQSCASGKIFKEFQAHTYNLERLPGTVKVTIAVHRDGVSRLRGVYDHYVKSDHRAFNLGIDHFAKHLPEYVAKYQSVAHHAAPQSKWLGSCLGDFTHVVPLTSLGQLANIVAKIIGKPPPAIPHVHHTANKTPVGPVARAYLQAWTAHDTFLGWDGATSSL